MLSRLCSLYILLLFIIYIYYHINIIIFRYSVMLLLLSILAAVWTEGTIIKIEEIEQREVLFRCSHSFAQSNDKYLCKDPCTQSTDKLVTVKAGGRAVSERITLVDSGNGVFTVIFSQLQMSDSGRYWCAVERIGWDTYTEVNLIVNKGKYLATETPNRSTTWAYQSISSSTQPTPETNTSSPTNLSASRKKFYILIHRNIRYIRMLNLQKVNFQPALQLQTTRMEAKKTSAQVSFHLIIWLSGD
uniref:Immunoglobulin domain-containing protein n=1 Tax=Mastacembelus armatus TaxID=205130 RepID=A0A3Q3M9Z1_9TELE